MLKNHVSNNSGMAAIEIIPMLVIIMFLVVFSLGFFGIVHTGILNSIGARNYAFETFRHRADLTYIREKTGSGSDLEYFRKGMRYHTTVDVNPERSGQNFPATGRRIDFLKPGEEQGNSENQHNNVLNRADLNRRLIPDVVGVNPVWLKIKYGICLNANCGGT